MKITLENIFVICGPKDNFDSNAEEEKLFALNDKRNKLDADEETFLEKEKSKVEKKKDDEDSFTSRLQEKIIDNIQIVVKNVHIRYQDLRNPERPIVGGTVAVFILFNWIFT